ncbi:MAG: hypothetical protein GX279_11715 [Clostridiaceae bacterium]|nr:hypothetical protein [Clostridiaceae bacterium]
MDTNTTETAKNTEMKKVQGKLAEGVERLLKSLFLTFFILLVLSQAVLTDPAVRAYNNKETIDGVSLGSEAYLFEPSKMELTLSNISYCPELKVMVNGDVAGAFFTDTILLELKEGDVVELDATRLLVTADVQITAVSSNKSELLGRSFEVGGGIVKVAEG